MGEYTDFLNTKLLQVQVEYDWALVDGAGFLNEVGKQVRDALLDNGIRLQNSDLRPRPTI